VLLYRFMESYNRLP